MGEWVVKVNHYMRISVGNHIQNIKTRLSNNEKRRNVVTQKYLAYNAHMNTRTQSMHINI